MKDIERVYKVTILARGRTGGHAMTSQEDDKGMYTRDELFARLVFALGGRAAEELVFGAPTTGASSDIENATKIARAMLTEYGFSPDLGTVKYGQEQGDPFAYGGAGGSIEYSDDVAKRIDEQMHYLLDRAHEQAYAILAEHRDYLDKLVELLLEKETLRRPDLEGVFDGIVPRESFDVFEGEDERFPQQAGREPIKTPVELAEERGEELPKRRTLLDATRAARERRLAGKVLAVGDDEEYGFNFGRDAGDIVDDYTEGTEPESTEEPAELADAPAAPAPEAPAPEADEPAEPESETASVQEVETEAGPEQEQEPEPVKPSPSTDKTTEIPVVRDAAPRGRHHKPSAEDAQPEETKEISRDWARPWGSQDAPKNPYADGSAESKGEKND